MRYERKPANYPRFQSVVARRNGRQTIATDFLHALTSKPKLRSITAVGYIHTLFEIKLDLSSSRACNHRLALITTFANVGGARVTARIVTRDQFGTTHLSPGYRAGTSISKEFYEACSKFGPVISDQVTAISK